MSRRTLIFLIVLLLVVVGIVWITAANKSKETPTPVLSVAAFNQTKNASATVSAAAPQDLIVYTLTAENQGDEVIPGYIMEANISEITDKASLSDASGASYNAATNSLVWTPLDIPAHDSITKQFSVHVNPLPAGSSEVVLNIKFNNELKVTVSNPKVAGSTTPTPTAPYKAPTSGPSGWLAVSLAFFATAIFIAVKKYKLLKA